MTYSEVLKNYTIEELSDKNLKLSIMKDYRKVLLDAFDIFKSNVNFGILEITDVRKEEIKTWYYELLNITITLDEDCLYNPPSEIIKYII